MRVPWTTRPGDLAWAGAGAIGMVGLSTAGHALVVGSMPRVGVVLLAALAAAGLCLLVRRRCSLRQGLAVIGGGQLLLHEMFGRMHEVCAGSGMACGGHLPMPTGTALSHAGDGLQLGRSPLLDLTCADAFDLAVIVLNAVAAVLVLFAVGTTDRLARALHGRRLRRNAQTGALPQVHTARSLPPVDRTPAIPGRQVLLGVSPRRGPPRAQAAAAF